MALEIGILFALSAFIFWGFGDFLIQKSARRIGDWETVFLLDSIGVIMLLPFVYNDFGSLLDNGTLILLSAASIMMLFASILDFEALKRGKIAVVEPIYALEVPIAGLFAFFVINESVGLLHSGLIALLLMGIVLVSLKSHHFKRKAWLEKGVGVALVGTLLMGITAFLFGFSTRIANPLLVVWVTNLFAGGAGLYYLMVNKKLGKLAKDVAKNRRLVLSVGLLDNFAWVAYGFATSLIPIVIATALSENYIVLAALLGLLVNKEALLKHQKIGLAVAVSSAVVLAVTFG